MTQTIYCEYADFGSEGIPPDTIELVFDDSGGYTVPDAVENSISLIWNQLVQTSSQLHDGDLLIVSGTADDGREIHLSRGSFRDYYSIRAILHNQSPVEDFEISQEIREFAQKQIKPLSSVTAVLARDKIVVGIKETDGGYQIAIPGSGYLDGEVDLNGDLEPKPVQDIVLREVEEELGIRGVSESVRCLGIYSECVADICLNPAFFSVCKISLTPEEVVESFTTAEDSWEFDSVFTIPLTSENLHKIVGGEFSQVPEFSEEVKTESLSNAPKTPLLLATVGRWKFGEDWFTNFTNEHGFEVLSRD